MVSPSVNPDVEEPATVETYHFLAGFGGGTTVVSCFVVSDESCGAVVFFLQEVGGNV